MAETVALFRLAVTKSRYLLLVALGALVIGQLTYLAAPPVNADLEQGSLAIAALLCSMLPAACATILLFDYGSENDMNLPESGCNHWLLRMPIHSWKIAVVPIALKTTWISGLWILFVATLRSLEGSDEIPVVAPCLCFSAVTIWVLVIAWRPFRSGWRRLIALLVAAPILYFGAIASVGAPFIDRIEWRSEAIVASQVASWILYVAAVWAAVRSVALARVSVFGVVPQAGTVETTQSSERSIDKIRDFSGVWHALLHKDWIKAKDWVRKVCMVLVAPTIIIYSVWVPLHTVSLIFALLAFAYFGGIAVSRSGSPSDNPQTLQPYLAASPISSATLAWTKFCGTMAIVIGVYSSVLVIFAAWVCWAENRETWMTWSAEVAQSLGRSSESFSIGVRCSIAIVFAWTVFFTSRIASYIWIGMTGRQWLGVVMALVSGLTFLVPLGIVLRWFMVQTDWESTKESALGYLQWAPYLVAGLLVLKGIGVTASLVALLRCELVSRSGIVRVVSIWTLITIAVAVGLTLLIPDPRATILWCVSITVLCIPLARVLVLPMALAWNRHR